MEIQVGKWYYITFENGSSIEGKLLDVKWIGGQVYSLWIDIGRQPAYIVFNDVKEIRIDENRRQ